MSQLTTDRNRWLHAIKMNKNPLTSSTNTQLIENYEFETVHMEGVRPFDGSKKKAIFLIYGHNKVPDMEIESFVNQNKSLFRFCDEVNWQGETLFSAFRDTLGGHLLELWDTTREDGSDWFDPGHADADEIEGVVRLLEAVLIQWTQDDSPGESLAKRIMNFQWKNHRTRGTYWRPSDFKQRLRTLWKLCDMLPSLGPQTSDRDKLRAVWDGLTEDARLYIKEEKGQDPFDTAGNGQAQMDWSDVFDLLNAYWNREFKKISDNFKEKRKRDDDDDDGDEDNNYGRRKKRRTGNGKESRRDNKRNKQRNGGSGGGDRNNRQGQGLSNFEKPCSLHEHLGERNHKYKDCIFCPTGKNFIQEKAHKYYESGKAPDWWKKTFEKKGLNSNSGPPQQQQQQQQQHFVQGQPSQHGTYSVLPYQQPLPPAPSQVAPVFASSTAPSAQPAQPPSQQLYSMQLGADGRSYFTPHTK